MASNGHHNRDTASLGNRYLQSILALVVILSVVTVFNSGLQLTLIINQNKISEDRAKTTREVVIAVGFCLKKREIVTQAQIEKCVKKTLGRPISPVGDFNESK